MPIEDRLAVCSWSLQPKSCDDLIERVRATSLSRVQLHLDKLAEDADGAWANTPTRLREAGITVVSGMVGCVGEDYSSIAAIERTGGVVPDETWPKTRERMRRCAPLAKELGINLVTFHAGFIPHDSADPKRATVRDRIQQAADLFAEQGANIALETGQESAEALLSFLGELGRNDVGVNFDPANMLLYGSGDPIEALDALLARVKQVHLKDAIPSGQAGEWGKEVPVGEGQVDWPSFFALLGKKGYTGPLPIEREAGDDRIGDVRKAIAFAGQVTAAE